nr:reverse transcriptase domain-containing protein [Tanacetum cinerariifolium]
ARIIRDIEETFKTLREINMKYNPKKCTFGMREGGFSRNKVNADGLKVCLDKVEAVFSLPSIKCLKDVQRLNGKLASLNRFLSKSPKKSCTKKSDFQWTAEADTTFKQMKKLIAELPMLTAPKEKKELVIYLTAAREAISAVLMMKRGGKQMPIYFVTRALQGPKINYTPMEKLILALLSASKRVKRYFQAHTIIVIMDHTIKQILSNPEDSEANGCKNLQANVDSRLVANQVNETYIAKEPGMIKYLEKFRPPEQTSTRRGAQRKSIDEKEVLAVVEEEGHTWMTQIYEYLIKEILQEEKRKARAIRRKAVDYLSKWVEAKALPTNDARVVVKFLKSLCSRFGISRATISDRGTHFCNDRFTKVMIKYGVTHRLATAYHPQTSGQVEVSNQGLKRILERTVGENRASWSDKLDDALWAFCTAFKTQIGCTPYKLVYRKSCDLSIELEHRAYWALKHVNFNLKTAGDHRKLQLNELNELRDQDYENSLIYKKRTKKFHDSKIKNRIFNVGDQVLLFNSCLKIFSGKLKTRWSGPFTITQVFPYGTVELSQPNGPNFK